MFGNIILWLVTAVPPENLIRHSMFGLTAIVQCMLSGSVRL